VTRRGHKLEAQNDSYCFLFILYYYEIKIYFSPKILLLFLSPPILALRIGPIANSAAPAPQFVSLHFGLELDSNYVNATVVSRMLLLLLLLLLLWWFYCSVRFGLDLRSMNLGNGKGSMSTVTTTAVMKSGDAVSDQFPAGLRVLVVDDDPTCLMILEKMLRTCLYEGTTLLLLHPPSVCCYCFLFLPVSYSNVR